MPFARILVAIDGSEPSDHALTRAIELATLTGGMLHALAVDTHALMPPVQLMLRAPSCTTGSNAKNSCRRPSGSAGSVWCCPVASRDVWS